MRRLGQEWLKAVAAHHNRHTLRDYQHLLEPGLWVFSGWELWVRVGRRLPEDLLYAKGNRRGPLLYRMVKALLSPLYWVVVPRTPEGSGEYFAMVKGPRIRREPIFFSDDTVLRVLATPRDSEQVRLRGLWDGHVTNSTVVVEKTTERFFVERRINNGQTATGCDAPALATPLRGVFRQYASLASESPQGLLASHRDDIASKMARSVHGALTRRCIEVVGEDAFWQQVVVPTGSDSSPDNAIITADGAAFFVDTEPIYVRPALCHPLGVIAGWDQKRGNLVSEYLRGGFDSELRALLPESARGVALDETLRMAWLVLAVLTPPVTPAVVRRKMRPLDGLLDAYGLRERATSLLFPSPEDSVAHRATDPFPVSRDTTGG